MADDDQTTDLSEFVPDNFKGDDGAYDTAGFRSSFDELATFKAQSDEATAALPENADGYALTIPEDHVLPEGFDPAILRQQILNEDGTPKMGEDGKPEMKEFDINEMISADDPDLPLLQAALHKHGANPALMGDLASILANQKIREVMGQADTLKEEKAALGPNGQSRIDTVTRAVAAMVPAGEAAALMNGVTSADALKGMEKLLQKSKAPPAAAPNAIDNASASIDERIDAGLKKRSA